MKIESIQNKECFVKVFDKEKIILSQIRAFKSTDVKSKSLYTKIANELISRSHIKNNTSILELWAKNATIKNNANNKNITFIQTIANENIKIKNKKLLVSDLYANIFAANTFDICYSMLSCNTAKDMLKFFSSIYNIIKVKGKFLGVFSGADSFNEFKECFYKLFPDYIDKSFLPSIDLQDLGKIGQISGYKNIVVDKDKFVLKIKNPSDIWNFIRGVGESSYLLERNKRPFNKDEYLKLISSIEEIIAKKKYFSTTITLNYFTGEK